MYGQKTLIGRLTLLLLRWNGAGVIYILDIAYNFRTAFIVVHNLRRSVVRDRVLIAEYYMRYSTFWPDLLAALPLVAEVGLTQMLLSPVVCWMFEGCEGCLLDVCRLRALVLRPMTQAAVLLTFCLWHQTL